MYVSHTNPLALRSQEELAQGLLALMKRHPYDEITITQICQEACLVRKTFYRNFKSKDDVLHFILDQHLFGLYQLIDFDSATFSEEMEKCFQFFYQIKELLTLLKSNRLFHLFSEKTVRYLKDTACTAQISSSILDPEMEDYFINFVASAVTATVELWIEKDFDQTPEELARFTVKVLHQGTNKA